MHVILGRSIYLNLLQCLHMKNGLLGDIHVIIHRLFINIYKLSMNVSSYYLQFWLKEKCPWGINMFIVSCYVSQCEIFVHTIPFQVAAELIYHHFREMHIKLRFHFSTSFSDFLVLARDIVEQFQIVYISFTCKS